MAVIFDGKSEAEKLNAETAKRVRTFASPPTLAIIRNNSVPSQIKFTNVKKRTADQLGIPCDIIDAPEGVTQDDMKKIIHDSAKSYTGILVQLPLPPKFIKFELFNEIPYEKDVEALGAIRYGEMFQSGRDKNNNRNTKFYSPVAMAMIHAATQAAQATDTQIEGSTTTIVGNNYLMGKPISLKMYHLGSTVTLCGSHTKDLAQHTRSSDFIFSCTGQRHLITTDMISDKAIAIDGGFDVNKKGQIYGDFHPEVGEKVAFFTPVPGGIGPLTVAYVFRNLCKLSR